VPHAALQPADQTNYSLTNSWHNPAAAEFMDTLLEHLAMQVR
jgi:hypothetical protein